MFPSLASVAAAMINNPITLGVILFIIFAFIGRIIYNIFTGSNSSSLPTAPQSTNKCKLHPNDVNCCLRGVCPVTSDEDLIEIKKNMMMRPINRTAELQIQESVELLKNVDLNNPSEPQPYQNNDGQGSS